MGMEKERRVIVKLSFFFIYSIYLYRRKIYIIVVLNF